MFAAERKDAARTAVRGTLTTGLRHQEMSEGTGTVVGHNCEAQGVTVSLKNTDDSTLPTFPLRQDEWRPSLPATHGDLSELSADADQGAGGYPLRDVVGRLRERAVRGAQRSVVVGLRDGTTLTYSDYLTQEPDEAVRHAVEDRIASHLLRTRQRGCVIAAVGHPSDLGLRPLDDEGASGLISGLIFDLDQPPLCLLLTASVLRLRTDLLMLELETRTTSVVDGRTPGARVLELLQAHSSGKPS